MFRLEIAKKIEQEVQTVAYGDIIFKKLYLEKKEGLKMVTLADVARRANVSKMTVSRVINHPEQVTDELKKLVFAAMHELDYRPNVAAKALAKNRTQIVKFFILEEISTVEPYYMNLLIGISLALSRHQYSLQLVANNNFNLGACD